MEIPALPAADWVRLHDKFYKRQEVYSVSWDFEFKDYLRAAAPSGGPIAFIRNDKRLLLAKRGLTAAPLIKIYTCAGVLLAEIPWEGGRLVSMGWTDQEKLVCVGVDGSVCIFQLDGQHTNFSLGSEAESKGVQDCRIWSNGLIALLSDWQLISVTDFLQPRPKMLADPQLSTAPNDWAIIPPNASLSRQPTVYMAVGATILLVDNVNVQDQILRGGPFMKIAISPNGGLVALFTEEGKILVISSDFQRSLSDFDTKSSLKPNLFCWCGTDSVVMFREHTLVLIGPFGDTINYPYLNGEICLIPEIDGVRIISQEKCEFIQKVPEALEDVFRIGSTTPAALLYEAYNLFEKGDPKSEEHIRDIKEMLPEAVDRCLEAAGYEFSIPYQKNLLRAASLGKSFLDNYSADAFVQICQRLRILNATRQRDVGIPLSYSQLQAMKPESLIACLTGRKMHLLALRICTYLRTSSDVVLVDWACKKIQKSKDEDEYLCRLIVEKLVRNPGLSYAEIAKTAFKQGRPRLASMLLDFEPKTEDKIPLLLSMDQDQQALIRAIESADADMVFFVLFQLRKKYSLGEFFRAINGVKMACDLLVAYATHQDRELLKDYFYQDDRRIDAINLNIIESFGIENTTERVTKLQASARSLDKAHVFEAKCIEEQIKLLNVQDQLQLDLEEKFQGLSLCDTIHRLVVLGQIVKANKLKTDFKLTDKRFCWIMLKGLVEKRDWEGLEKFAFSKKSPIGYLPFVEECIRAVQFNEAIKYVNKCDKPIQPILYLKIGAFKEAAALAFQMKDLPLLRRIREQCVDRIILEEVEVYISQLLK